MAGNGATGSYPAYNKQSTGYPQTGVASQAYNNSNYVNAQVSNSSNYPSVTNSYSTYNQTSYQTQQQSNLSNNVNSNSNATSVSNTAAVQNIPVGNSNAVNNSRYTTIYFSSIGFFSRPFIAAISLFPLSLL